MKNIYLLFLFVGSVVFTFGQNTIGANHFENPKSGIYWTFDDFLKQTIDDSTAFLVLKTPRANFTWKGTDHRELVSKENQKKIKDAWGFCEDGKIFIWYQFDFFELKYSDQKMKFYGYKRYKENYVLKLLEYGILGSEIALKLEKDQAFNERYLYYVDFNSGQIYNQVEFGAIKNRIGKAIIYRTTLKKAEQDINIVINDKVQITMYRNAYYFDFFDPSQNPLKICVKDDESSCLFIHLDQDQPTYIKCDLDEYLQVGRLKKISASEGLVESEIVRKKQGNRNRNFKYKKLQID